PDGRGGVARRVSRLLGHVRRARRGEDYCSAPALLGKSTRIAAYPNRLARILAVDGDVDLLAEDFQLIDGGGTLEVGSDQQRLAAVVAQVQGELAGRGRLALPLQAAEHDDRRAFLGEVETVVHRPHDGDQLVVNHLDNLLARVERAQHGLSNGALGDASGEGVDDVVIDVGVEQGAADFLEPVADVRLAESAAPAQLLERFAQGALKAFKHGGITFCSRRRAAGPEKRRLTTVNNAL